MAIRSRTENAVALFEVKHSDKALPEQARHLIDESKIDLVERVLGIVVARTVLYRGPAAGSESGIAHVNVERYLDNLEAADVASGKSLPSIVQSLTI